MSDRISKWWVVVLAVAMELGNGASLLVTPTTNLGVFAGVAIGVAIMALGLLTMSGPKVVVTGDMAAEVWKVYGNYLLGFDPGAGRGIEAMKVALEAYERMRK